MAEGSLPEQAFDTSVPNHARVYDYWLGGKDNYAADREAAQRQARAVRQLPWLARQNREFLQRAVRFCAGGGITQFLDLGSGLPTNQNVHEVARLASPDARVEPGLTDIWAWRPDAETAVTTTEVMRILGGVGRKG